MTDCVLQTREQVEEFVGNVAFGSVLSFFGSGEGVVVLDARDPDAGLHGWVASWSFKKKSVDNLSDFSYSVNVYVPTEVTIRRALELIVERFKVFVDHELREGLIYRHEWPLRPHRLLPEKSHDSAHCRDCDGTFAVRGFPPEGVPNRITACAYCGSRKVS